MQASSFSASFLRSSDVKLKQFELSYILDKCLKSHSTQPWLSTDLCISNKRIERWKGPKRSSFLNSYVTCKEAKVQRGLGSQWLIKSWFWYSTLLYIANGSWCLVNIPWKHASRIFALTSNSRGKFLQILLLYFESCYRIDIGTVNVTII